MLTPDKFSQAPVYDLLQAAAQGKAGLDQRWLRAILDRGDAAVPDLLRFGLEDRSQDNLSIDDELILIFRHLGTPEAVQYYLAFLERNPYDIPDHLPEAMYPVREAALEPLLELYDKLDEEEAGEIAFLLASFRIHDDRVRKILIDRLDYDVTDGAISLGLYGDPSTRPALERMLGEVEDDEFLKKQIESAIDDLGRPVENGGAAGSDIFAEFPETALPDSDVLDDEDLIEMLGSHDAEYRFAAAAGFINRDLDEDLVAKLFDRARTDENAEVRAKCWEALSDESQSNEEIFTAMLARLEDETAPKVERAGALIGLGNKSNEQPIRKYAEQFYDDKETRAAALAAMWNSLDKGFAKFFPPHVNDPDHVVRKQAISGIGYLGIAEAAEKLRDYFEDDDFRPNALFAYALSARSETSPARVRALLRRIEELAGGLSEQEDELVKIALDERLMLAGKKPVFHAHERRHEHGPDCDHEHAHEHAHEAAPAPAAEKAGRNDPCPCGSGKKYKKCCGA